jgi:DNA-binding transcriptional LysR family regulator
MDLRQLKLFCRIVDRRSFSLAAEEMNITQPAASFQVRGLERDLRTTLLDRSRRDVVPTDAGQVLYDHAKVILDLVGQARVEIANLGDLMAGHVSVGASTGPGEHILPALITRFKERHPAVGVSLRVTDTHDVIEEVIARELEVGVVGALSHRKELAVRPFARDEIVVICAPDHPWAEREHVSFAEFRKEPLIVQQRGAGIRSVMEEHLKRRSITERDLNIVLEMGLNESAKHAVMAGAGVSYLSKFAVRTEVEQGTLTVVRIDDFRVERDFYYVHSRTRVVSKAVQAFLEYLGEQYETLS